MFDHWVGNIPWRREKLPTPVFWPGEFHELVLFLKIISMVLQCIDDKQWTLLIVGLVTFPKMILFGFSIHIQKRIRKRK